MACSRSFIRYNQDIAEDDARHNVSAYKIIVEFCGHLIRESLDKPVVHFVSFEKKSHMKTPKEVRDNVFSPRCTYKTMSFADFNRTYDASINWQPQYVFIAVFCQETNTIYTHVRLVSEFQETPPGDAERRTMTVNHETGCAHCGAAAFQRCSRCKTLKYCSRACQVNHWPNHKHDCARLNNTV